MSERPGAAALRAAAHQLAARLGDGTHPRPGTQVLSVPATAVEIRLFLPWTRPAWPAATHTRPLTAHLREILATPFRHHARVKAVPDVGGLSVSAYVAPERFPHFLAVLARLPELLTDTAVPLPAGQPVAPAEAEEPAEDAARRHALRLLPAGPGTPGRHPHAHLDWRRAHLVVVGPLDGDLAAPAWPADPSPADRPADTPPPASLSAPLVGRRAHDVHALGVVCLLGGAPAAEELVATLIGGSHSGHLVETLRERLGIAYAPATVVSRRSGPAHLWTWLPVHPAHVDLLTETLARATRRAHRCSADRLDRAKSHLAGNLERSLADPRALANLLIAHPPAGLDGGTALPEHYTAVADTAPHQADAAADALLRRCAVLVTGPDDLTDALPSALSHHGG